MNKPLWALAGIALRGTAGGVGIVFASTGGGEKESVQFPDTATVSPTIAASSRASPIPSSTPSAIQTTSSSSPNQTQPPAPEGFVPYRLGSTSAVPPFTFAYPANWFLEGGDRSDSARSLTLILTPWDPKTAPGHGGIPDNSMKVDIYAVDYASQADGCARPSGSSQPAELGGEAGWTTTNPLEDDPTVLARVVAADHFGFQYCVVGYLADPPDTTIFDRIIESFRFAE